MFTGLVEAIGVIARAVPGEMTTLWIDAPPTEPYVRGESIAVNGCCLTVVEPSSQGFSTQASPETLRRTALGTFRPGTRVNLERSMKVGARLGGHLVQGHVDAVSKVAHRAPEGGSLVMAFELPESLSVFVVEKGSIAVDGVSLTVNHVDAARFQVALIPETVARTTLGDRKPGDAVNLEVDVIGKYVARMLGQRAGAGLSEETLRAAGFERT